LGKFDVNILTNYTADLLACWIIDKNDPLNLWIVVEHTYLTNLALSCAKGTLIPENISEISYC